MKQIAPNYTYNKTTGVITLTGVNIDRDQLLLIVNTTRNVTYYNFADSATTLQAFTQGANTSITLASSVISASSTHANADALTIYYDDQSSVVSVKTDLDVNSSQPCVALAFDSPGGVQRVGNTNGFPIRPMQDGSGNSIPLAISGAVTANNVIFNDVSGFQSAVQAISDIELNAIRSAIWIADSSGSNGSASEGQILSQNYPMPISGTVTAIDSALTGTITLVNNTAVEIPNAGEYGSVVLEVVLSGVTWGSNNIVAQAHNQSGSATDVQIMSPIGIRVMHSADSTYGLANTYEGSVGYVSLEPNGSFSGFYGTALHRYETSAGTQTSSLLTNRFFIFDISASRFFLKANFTAGTISVNYRLYRNKHPALSNRRVIATGDGSSGAVRVEGSVSINGGGVYLDGGYLDDTSSIEYAVGNSLSGWAGNLPQISVQSGRASVNTYPTQGTTATNTNFSSATSATLASAVSTREVLTVFNEGPATLFINAGTSASTTSYQVRLLAGDYWEAPAGQQSLQHSGIFSSAGSAARVTEIS